MIADILPPHVAVASKIGESSDGPLLAEEEAVLGRVAERRRRDFTIARSCAREALALLGVPPTPILPGPSREPLWPEGIVGSITHCPGYGAAAVAHRARYASMGIDAELHDTLPDGVLRIVALPQERAWLEFMPGNGVCWDRVLFSAKESIYKAWFPLAGKWLGFEDALITFDPEEGRFHGRLLVPGPTVDGRVLTDVDGRFQVREGFVLTAVTVPSGRPTA